MSIDYKYDARYSVKIIT